MLHVRDITYRIAGRTILANASVHIPAGWKVGVVGANGAGKSTLFNLILGRIEPDLGDIRLRPRARIGTVAQEAPGGPTSLIDYVLSLDTERRDLLQRAETETDGAQLAEVHERLNAIEADKAPARAATILSGLGFDHAAQQRPLQSFSGGWRMRVALAGVLFLEPDLLLLDEPTNYLDLEGTIWLESYLARYPHTVMVVSHDRDLLNGPVNAILHVHNAGLEMFRGTYDQFEEARRLRQEEIESQRAKQEAQRKHMQAFVDRFRYKASKARQAQSRLKALERLQPLPETENSQNLRFGFPEVRELRPPLIVAEKLAVGYEPGKPVLSRLDFRIDPDDRIALLGKNGNGKSTMAKLLSNRLKPQAGELRLHNQLSVGYFAQHQIEDLEPYDTAVEHLSRFMPGVEQTKVRARLGAFGLAQDKADVFCSSLSGGERARLVLATISVDAPTLLILDEPTNHLDVDARQALVEALNAYGGAVLLISHDRHVVELVAERLWLVADGTVTPWDGDMNDYRRFLLSGSRPARNDTGETADGAGGGQKQKRQNSAERRARLAPLRQQAQKAEKELNRLTDEQRKLEALLADPATHNGNGADVAALHQRHGALARAVEEAEIAWLAAAEALDEAQAD